MKQNTYLFRYVTETKFCRFDVKLGFGEVLTAEVWGLYYGVSVASRMGFHHVLVDVWFLLLLFSLSMFSMTINISYRLL